MTDVQISVGDEHLDAIEEVAAGVRARGLNVTQVLDLTGIIYGTSDREIDDLRADLLSIPGVASVEEVGYFQVPPPGSDIQ